MQGCNTEQDNKFVFNNHTKAVNTKTTWLDIPRISEQTIYQYVILHLMTKLASTNFNIYNFLFEVYFEKSIVFFIRKG